MPGFTQPIRDYLLYHTSGAEKTIEGVPFTHDELKGMSHKTIEECMLRLQDRERACQRELKALRKQIKKLREDPRAEIDEQASEFKRERRGYRQKISELKQTNDEQRATIVMQERDIAIQNHEFEKLSLEFFTLTRNHACATNAAYMRNIAVTAEKKEFKTTLVAKDEEIAKLKSTIDATRGDELERTIARQAEEIKELKKAKPALDAERQKLQRTHESYSDAMVRFTDLNQSIMAENKSKAEKIKTQAEEIKVQAKEIADLRSGAILTPDLIKKYRVAEAYVQHAENEKCRIIETQAAENRRVMKEHTNEARRIMEEHANEVDLQKREMAAQHEAQLESQARGYDAEIHRLTHQNECLIRRQEGYDGVPELAPLPQAKPSWDPDVDMCDGWAVARTEVDFDFDDIS